MAGWAHRNGLKACGNGARPGARWLHTCRGPVSSFRTNLRHLRSSSQDSAPPSRRCGSLTKSLRMSRRGMGERTAMHSYIEQAAAVRMVARGCACGRTVGRCRARVVRACSRRPSRAPRNRRGRKTHGTLFSALWQGTRICCISFFGKTAAWGRLVGRQRVQKRSQSRKKRSF